MIDEAKAKAESEKLLQMVELAMEIDADLLREIRPDVEFVATVADGFVAQMMLMTLKSTDAFLEYRAKLDVIVEENGLEFLRGQMPDA